MISGGSNPASQGMEDIWRFNAKTKKWEPAGKMKNGRYYHAVSVVTVEDFCPR